MQKILINEKIRAKEVRLINEIGEQLGIVPIEQAISQAKKKGLDLVQVTEKAEPPVCKIISYGKYLYQLQKKEKKRSHKKGGEIKGVRIKFNTSEHDLKTRANQAQKFLEKGNKIKLEMILRGREKALKNRVQEQINKFLEFLKTNIPIEIEREDRKQRNAIIIIIKKGQK